MKLIRGCKRRYAPDVTGGLRLSKARFYRTIGDEDGIGDEREGEIRVSMPASVTRLGGSDFDDSLMDMSLQMGPDEPAIKIEGLMTGKRREVRQELRVEDSGLNDSPFVLCLSREPNTKHEWETLRAALPQRFDTWTVTDDVDALQFEIECGIERWMKLNGITERWLVCFKGWVTYPYHTTPPAVKLDDLDDMKLLTRWFQKGRKYSDQQEYRLAWVIRSPQMETLPDAFHIELTKTGLSLFSPWSPPTR
ncbi:MAG: hypothetical protein OXC99_11745 [Chloroflexi bacterium]|nr:hypothetical protein [Chloroflexota bacterium]